MEIYLIRHTTPEIEKGICYGQSDILLARDFKLEAKHILTKIPSTTQVIYTSPLLRCSALAEFIKSSTQFPMITDSRLKELNFGDWEMKAWNDIEPSHLFKWMNSYETEPCPNGESYADLVIRVKDFIEDLKKRKHDTVVVVTHGGVIKTFHAVLRGISLRAAMDVKVLYGEVIIMNCPMY